MTEPVLTVELTELPEPTEFKAGIRRAPDRGYTLNAHDTKVALANALRYVPAEHHEIVAPEFLEELKTRGRIEMEPGVQWLILCHLLRFRHPDPKKLCPAAVRQPDTCKKPLLSVKGVRSPDGTAPSLRPRCSHGCGPHTHKQTGSSK